MKKPDFRPLAKEDFAEAPWIDRLIRPLNTVLGALVSGVQNGLTLSENLNAEIKTLDVTLRDDWIAPTLAGTWANVGGTAAPAGYRRDGQIVTLRGALAGGAGTVFTLPDGYRPTTDLSFAVASGVAGTATTVSVTTAGVVAFGGGVGSLSGVTFHAAGRAAGNGAFPVKFKTKITGSVAGVVILRCVELDKRNEYLVHGSLSAQWKKDGESLLLEGVSGLTGGRTYRLTLLALGG